jgi:hypothetical protein
MAAYYDVVLALIPLVLVGIATSLYLGGLVLTSAVSVAGLVTLGVVGHAMFVRGPVDAQPTAAPHSSSVPPHAD